MDGAVRSADDIWEELFRESREWGMETGLSLTQYVLSCGDYDVLAQDIQKKVLRYGTWESDPETGKGDLYVYLSSYGRTKIIPWP